MVGRGGQFDLELRLVMIMYDEDAPSA